MQWLVNTSIDSILLMSIARIGMLLCFFSYVYVPKQYMFTNDVFIVLLQVSPSPRLRLRLKGHFSILLSSYALCSAALESSGGVLRPYYH